MGAENNILKKPFNPERGEKYIELLLYEADSLFEENEDLCLALIGGLAVQEFYSTNRKRKSSDIDITSLDERIVERLAEREYELYKNEVLDKYSAKNYEKQIHIDIYTGKVNLFDLDKTFFDNRVEPEGYNLQLASPEDITTMKTIPILTADRGKGKHYIDIYCMVLNSDIDFDLEYLAKRIKTKILPKITVDYPYVVTKITKPSTKILEQFSKKERRFLESELNIIEQELLKKSSL